ncbi:uncharacterized protein Dana_GF14564 [Drosophila ananassae]|uniref:MICOS complex subunit MIC13 n=1 Tax=Drosophila ananassae TaxID=7217 RepID=B3MJS2_DROAN|nr:uncharacterized protein LOC6497386 [Drosophila ananassae]EDV31411.1 uncharacterized protein Dana_GF14564 [Drosophila ananassae]
MLFSLIFRLALVAGTVYATKELDIWGPASNSEDLIKAAKKELGPYAENMKQSVCCWRCKTCTEVTVDKPWRESFVDAWNDTIKKAFNGLGIDVPVYFRRFQDDVANGIDDLVNINEEW